MISTRVGLESSRAKELFAEEESDAVVAAVLVGELAQATRDAIKRGSTS